MATYRGYTYNAAGDPAPWGAIENTLDQNLVDNMHKDCVEFLIDADSVSDTTNGHRHYRMWQRDASAVGVDIDASGNIVFTPKDAGGIVRVVDTAPGATGPIIELWHNSPSPAGSDVVGRIEFHGEDSISEKTRYAYIQTLISDAGDGGETSYMQFYTMNAGSPQYGMFIGDIGVSLPTGDLRVTTGDVIIGANNKQIKWDFTSDYIGSTNGDGLTIHATDDIFFDAQGTHHGDAVEAYFGGNDEAKIYVTDSSSSFIIEVTEDQRDIEIVTHGDSDIILDPGSRTTRLYSASGGAAGPVLEMYHESASPANSDVIGDCGFYGENGQGDKTRYGRIYCDITDIFSGSEEGRMRFAVANHGAEADYMTLDPGLASVRILQHCEIDGDLNHDGSNVGFYATTPIAKPTVSGAKGGNAALTSLCTQLAALGLVTDSTS